MNRNEIEALRKLEDLYLADDPASFAQSVVRLIESMFSGCIVAWHDTDIANPGSDYHHSNNPRIGSRLHLIWSKVVEDSPIVKYHLTGGKSPVTHTRQLCSMAEMKGRRFYNESWRPFGMVDQIGVGAATGTRIMGVSIKRDRLFRDSEIQKLKILAPHIVRNCRRCNVLGGVCGERLTRREREILGWVKQGKRNSEISDILGISALTVAKHVEHIREKLGVETRGAAADFMR